MALNARPKVADKIDMDKKAPRRNPFLFVFSALVLSTGAWSDIDPRRRELFPPGAFQNSARDKDCARGLAKAGRGTSHSSKTIRDQKVREEIRKDLTALHLADYDRKTDTWGIKGNRPIVQKYLGNNAEVSEGSIKQATVLATELTLLITQHDIAMARVQTDPLTHEAWNKDAVSELRITVDTGKTLTIPVDSADIMDLGMSLVEDPRIPEFVRGQYSAILKDLYYGAHPLSMLEAKALQGLDRRFCNGEHMVKPLLERYKKHHTEG